MDAHLRPVHSELPDDVLLDPGCGRRCHGDDGAGTKDGESFPQESVIGPEIMPPLGYAVGLINGNEDRFPSCKHLGKARYGQPLRSDEEEIQAPLKVFPADLTRCNGCPAGMNPRCFEPLLLETCRLILHQGDERADHKGCSTARNSGELIAQGFPGSCGHDQEEIMAPNDGFTDILLKGPERTEMKHFLQQTFQVAGMGLSPPFPVPFPIGLFPPNRDRAPVGPVEGVHVPDPFRLWIRPKIVII